MLDADVTEKRAWPPEILSSASSAIVPLKEELPDGGLRAWLQVLGAFFMYFNTWGNYSIFHKNRLYFGNI